MTNREHLLSEIANSEHSIDVINRLGVDYYFSIPIHQEKIRHLKYLLLFLEDEYAEHN